MISILCSTVHPRYCGSDGRHRFRVRPISRSGKQSRGTQFTYFTTLLYYFKITDTDRAMLASGKEARGTLYLLYQYKSTDTDTCGALQEAYTMEGVRVDHTAGTQFTCFTGTKLQILTAEALQS